MKKNRKRGLAPGTAGFPKLYSGKEPKWGQNEGPRRGILKRRGGERNARPKQFYNTGRRCDIAPSCFLLSGKGPKLSLSLPTLSFSLSPTLHSLPATPRHSFTYTSAQLWTQPTRTLPLSTSTSYTLSYPYLYLSFLSSSLPLFLTTPFSSVVFLPLSSSLLPGSINTNYPSLSQDTHTNSTLLYPCLARSFSYPHLTLTRLHPHQSLPSVSFYSVGW